MPKSVEFERIQSEHYPYRSVRITMTNKPWGGTAKTKQFTVAEDDLISALKAVGLHQTIVAEGSSPDILLAEIQWYGTLTNLSGGTPSVRSQRDVLWARITKKLRLSS